ncbi:MAG: hypothetical protein K2N73_06955 [Lachnospiraceae bacterium]|nr:hypothetical protein [Lachnospiraceae bacterium]
MSSFKESLYERKSFIYQIGEEFYAIGTNTFAKVTDLQELDNIELMENALKKGNDRQIAKYLEKIIRIANSYRKDAKEHYKIQDRLFKVIDRLEAHDEKAFKALQEQVFRFDELYVKYQQQIKEA